MGFGGIRISDGDRMEVGCHSDENRMKIGWKSDAFQLAGIRISDAVRMKVGWVLEASEFRPNPSSIHPKRSIPDELRMTYFIRGIRKF